MIRTPFLLFKTGVHDLIKERKIGRKKSNPISNLKIVDLLLVRAGEKKSVAGKVVTGSGSVNQAPITSERIPQQEVNKTIYFNF